MQEWLENSDILVYSVHNKGKSVIAERFIKTLKATIHKKWQLIMANFILVLNKLVDQHSNSYHHSINWKYINADYSALTENLKKNPKVPKFKVNDRVRITSHTSTFSKGYTENWPREIFIIDSVLKTKPWTYKIKDITGERIIGNFYENKLLWSKL